MIKPLRPARRERLTFTIPEAAELLGIGRGSAYEAVKRGEIPVIMIGRRRVVPRTALDHMLANPATGKT